MEFLSFPSLTLVIFCTLIPPFVYAQDAVPSPTKDDVKYSESTGYSPRVLSTKKKDDKKDKTANKPPAILTADSGTNRSTITIPVSVFTNAGTLITDLKDKDFSAFVDGEPVEIISVESSKQPVNVFLLIDVSPSTEFRMNGMKELAVQIVNKLDPSDRVIVARFADSLKIGKETTDRKLVEKEIRKLKYEEGTALYNAVADIGTKYDLSSGINALILLTDGVDTTSQRNNYEKSLVAVEKTNAKAFVIYMDTRLENQPQAQSNLIIMPTFPMPKGLTEEAYRTGRLYLTDLIQLSGGHLIPTTPTPETNPWLDLLTRELHGQYILTIRPPITTIGRHNIKLRVSRPELTVLAKGSYLGQ